MGPFHFAKLTQRSDKPEEKTTINFLDDQAVHNQVMAHDPANSLVEAHGSGDRIALRTNLPATERAPT
jgi:hypothetical protein